MAEEFVLTIRDKAQKQHSLASKDRDQNLVGRRKLLSYFSLRHEYDFLPVSGEIVHLRCHFIQDRGFAHSRPEVECIIRVDLGDCREVSPIHLFRQQALDMCASPLLHFQCFLNSTLMRLCATVLGLIEFNCIERNQLRPTRLEIVGSIGAQEEEKFLPLLGVSVETKGDAANSVEIILGGETAAEERHLDHTVRNVERIAPLIGTTGLEEGLGIQDSEDVKTLLRFETLPEIEATTH